MKADYQIPEKCYVCQCSINDIGEQENGMCDKCNRGTHKVKLRHEGVFLQEDQSEDPVEWAKGLGSSGYAGTKKNGDIVDRREFRNAKPMQVNTLFGIAKPKELNLQ